MRMLPVIAIAAISLASLEATTAKAKEQIFYFHNDHLGTPQMMTDQAARVVWEAEYDPFGKATVNEDPDGDGILVTNNLRFPGQYYDAETGLHYNWHRFYDPDTGRYLSPDPLGIMRGKNNLYSYAASNPIMHFDLRGLDFTNNCRKTLWVRIENRWEPVAATKTLKGDTDGVCEGPDVNGKCTTYKWIDCYDASADCDDSGKMNTPVLTWVANKNTAGKSVGKKMCCSTALWAEEKQAELGGPKGADEFGEKPTGCK